MNILISNDDGIDAVGLRTLAKKLSEIADVYVCAPDSERSGFSHHFTIMGTMKIEEKEIEGAKKAYALYGTPSDCVHCALQFIYRDISFDMVVSGINRGWNVSSDAIYSGTVAGAREAFIQGVPAIAVSLNTFEEADYSFPAKIAAEVIRKHLDNPNKDKYFLNVNVPFLPEEECKGYAVCDASGFIKYDEHYYYETIAGETYVRTGHSTFEAIADKTKNIDMLRLADGYITIVPLNNDAITHDYIDDVSNLYL